MANTLSGYILLFLTFYAVLALVLASFVSVDPSGSVGGLAAFSAQIHSNPMAGTPTPGALLPGDPQGNYYFDYESSTCNGDASFLTLLPTAPSFSALTGNISDYTFISGMDESNNVYQGGNWTVILYVYTLVQTPNHNGEFSVQIGYLHDGGLVNVCAKFDPFFDVHFQVNDTVQDHVFFLNQTVGQLNGFPWGLGGHHFYARVVRVTGDVEARVDIRPNVHTSRIIRPDGQVSGGGLDWAAFLLKGLVDIVVWGIVTAAVFFGSMLLIGFTGSFGPFGPFISIVTFIFLSIVALTIFDWFRGRGGE